MQVDKIEVRITCTPDKTADLVSAIKAWIQSKKTSGDILYASGRPPRTVEEPEEWEI